MTTNNRKFISTDLSGYIKYLANLGYSERHIEFLQLAPKRLFLLFGSYASYEFLLPRDYRLKFLDLIRAEYKPGTLKKYSSGIKHFRDYLLSVGELIVPECKSLTKYETYQLTKYYDTHQSDYFKNLEEKYHDYLLVERNYCSTEVGKKLSAYRKFSFYLMENVILSLQKLDGRDVVDFGNQSTTGKTAWKHLITFLTFAYREGYAKTNFSSIIIRERKRTHTCKKYLKKNDVELLLNTLPRKTPWDKRDYAMLLLMWSLGLRPSEIIRIQLNDLDWVNSAILVRGKGGREDWLPLSSEVALAIVDYLKCAPRGETKHLFVKNRPPHSKLKNTFPLKEALIQGYRLSSLKPPTQNIRLNVFRHSFATNLVNSDGANFYGAQSAMRHASPEMTLHYAKYHSKKLDFFSHDWPGAEV